MTLTAPKQIQNGRCRIKFIPDSNGPSLGTTYWLPNCTVVIYKAPFENKVCHATHEMSLSNIQAQVFCTLFRFGARFAAIATAPASKIGQQGTTNSYYYQLVADY